MRNSSTVAKSGAHRPRQVYGCPATFPEDRSSVNVGVGSEATGPTVEPILGLTIGLFGVPADRALPATVARINRDQQHSGKRRLVGQEKAQLRESPRMQNSTLRKPGLNSVSDVCQFFNYQSAACAFSFRNDLLGNYVVGMAGEALFLAGQFLQAARCRSGLDSLELSPHPAMAETDRLQFRTGVPLAVRISGDITDAKVNAQEVGRIDRSRVGEIDSAVQIELPLAVDQIGLPLDPIKALLLVLAINQRDDHATFGQRPQADFIKALEAEDSLIVSNGSVGLERWAYLLTSVEALDGLADGAHGHLSGESEPISNLTVCQFVNRRLGKYTGIEPTPRRKGCGFIHALHCRQQPSRLFRIGQQPQLERQLHYNGVYHSLAWVASEKQATNAVAALSLRMAEASGFSRKGGL